MLEICSGMKPLESQTGFCKCTNIFQMCSHTTAYTDTVVILLTFCSFDYLVKCQSRTTVVLGVIRTSTYYNSYLILSIHPADLGQWR